MSQRRFPDVGVRDVHVRELASTGKGSDDRSGNRHKRNRCVAFWLGAGWLFIALKSALVWWACRTYPVPFSAWWVIGPTVAFGALCTAVFLLRNKD